MQTGLSATLIVAHSMCARNVIWGKRKILQKLNSMKEGPAAVACSAEASSRDQSGRVGERAAGSGR